MLLVLVGPNTWFPLQGVSTKQTAVSHSSTESELVAADHGLRREGIPMLDLLELLAGYKFPFEQYGDNQSTITIIRTGVNNTMRHFNRQHGIDLAFIHDNYKAKLMSLDYCVTDRQCADIFTKHCIDVAKWSRLLPQIGHYQLNAGSAPWSPKMKPLFSGEPSVRADAKAASTPSSSRPSADLSIQKKKNQKPDETVGLEKKDKRQYKSLGALTKEPVGGPSAYCTSKGAPPCTAAPNLKETACPAEATKAPKENESGALNGALPKVAAKDAKDADVRAGHNAWPSAVPSPSGYVPHAVPGQTFVGPSARHDSLTVLSSSKSPVLERLRETLAGSCKRARAQSFT